MPNPLQIVRMAGSLPGVRQLVNLYNKIPTAVNPVRTRETTTLLGTFGKMINPLNPFIAIPTGASILLNTDVDIPPMSVLDLLGISGSTPQGDNKFDNWQRLGYKSKADMIARVSAQEQKENPRPYQGPPVPPNLPRRNPTAATQGGSTEATQTRPRPTRGAEPTGSAPPAPILPPPPPRTGTAATPAKSELAQIYAEQVRLGKELGAQEMVRRLTEARPMTTVNEADLIAWATQNPALAYREMLRRESLVPQTSSL